MINSNFNQNTMTNLQILPIECLPILNIHTSMLVSSIIFNLDSLIIKVQTVQKNIDESDLPLNIHDDSDLLNKIKYRKYQNIEISDDFGKKLLVNEFPINNYFRLFSSSSLVKNAIKELFDSLVYNDYIIDDTFLQENIFDEVHKTIDFSEFIEQINNIVERESNKCANLNLQHDRNNHKFFTNVQKHILNTPDHLSHILSFIDLPSLSKTRLVSTHFLQIIEGCVMPKNTIQIMNQINRDFMIGCFYNVGTGSHDIITKYSNYMQNLKEKNNDIIPYVREYILLKCINNFGFIAANKLLKHMINKYGSSIQSNLEQNDEQNPEIDIDNLSLTSASFDKNKVKHLFIDKYFRDLSIIYHFVREKKINDLYSLINLKIICGSELHNDHIGHYVLTSYGYEKFLSIYLKNNWKCFPKLRYYKYSFYSKMVYYICDMMKNNINIPNHVQIFFLEIVTEHTIGKFSKRTATNFINEAIERDNSILFSKIYISKKIKKSKKMYLNLIKKNNLDCKKILNYLESETK